MIEESVDFGQRYVIKHPWLGYFVKMERTQWETAKFSETWSKDLQEAQDYTLAELRQSVDGSGRSFLGILVTGYTGLSLEKVWRVSKEPLAVPPESGGNGGATVAPLF